MKTNEIKDLIINRIDDGGFGNQWLYLTVIGDSDCCLMLSKHKVDLIPEYNVGWSYYSDLFLFNNEEMDSIHAFFIEELSKYTFSNVVFYGGLFVDSTNLTLKLRGCLGFHSDKGDGIIYELAEIYGGNFRTKGIHISDVLMSKIELIEELSAIIPAIDGEIHEVSEIYFEGSGTTEYVSMLLEITFRI